MKRSQLVKLVKEELNKKQTVNENLDDILSRFIQTDDSSELKAYIKGLPDMARNKLAKIFKIELDEEVGYSKYAPGGTTKGGTTKDFMNILTKIAKGKADKYQGDPQRGNKILDKANPENVARISRGEEPIYEGEDQHTYLVYFKIGEDDEDDVEVKASSPEEAIKKLQSGEVKLAYGQSLPRLARSFSAKLINK